MVLVEVVEVVMVGVAKVVVIELVVATTMVWWLVVVG